MDLGKSLPFYPQQLLAQGVFVLSSGLLFAGALGFFLTSQSLDPIEVEINRPKESLALKPLKIDLGLGDSPPRLPFPELFREISISIDSPRPDEFLEKPPLLVKLIQTGESKRFTLPCRIDLFYDSHEKISFKEGPSPFWIELEESADGNIETKVFMEGVVDKPALFAIPPQKNPLLSLEEIPIGSPFRTLAEGRWWGRDLFCEKYGGAATERIEIGPLIASEILDIKEGDWLTYQGGKWKKIVSLDEGRRQPVARIRSLEAKQLILEGWDQTSYYSFVLSFSPLAPFKVKPEELLTSVRVRSDRQISCMLEKQCLILKTGDWVFKGEGRWRILRKKEDRDALQAGKLIGEVFVFDRIDLEMGQKTIRGSLFNLSRSQVVPIELVAKSSRMNVERKTRGRPR